VKRYSYREYVYDIDDLPHSLYFVVNGEFEMTVDSTSQSIDTDKIIKATIEESSKLYKFPLRFLDLSDFNQTISVNY
jgi:hypothetical protein